MYHGLPSRTNISMHRESLHYSFISRKLRFTQSYLQIVRSMYRDSLQLCRSATETTYGEKLWPLHKHSEILSRQPEHFVYYYPNHHSIRRWLRIGQTAPSETIIWQASFASN